MSRLDRYHLLARATIGSEYHADGRARLLRFLPDAQSQLVLRAYGLVCRSDGSELAVLGEERDLLRLWTARHPATLNFSLSCDDPAHLLYREAAALPALSLALFEGEHADFTAWLQSPSRQQHLQLAARRTVWKYLLLGDWAGQQPELHDPLGLVQFEAATPLALGDGRSALAIRSGSALPLAERAVPRFQLRDANAHPPRLLMARLPVAAPGGLQREPDGTPVSEIFVSR